MTPGCSSRHPASACLAAATCAGVGVWVEVVLGAVWVVGAAPPVEPLVVVELGAGALCVVAGVLLVVLEVAVVGVVVDAADVVAVGVDEVLAELDADCCFELPQPASAAAKRMAMTARFIGPR